MGTHLDLLIEGLTLSPLVTLIYLYLCMTTAWWLHTYWGGEKSWEPIWMFILFVGTMPFLAIPLGLALCGRMLVSVTVFDAGQDRPRWYDTFPLFKDREPVR